MAPSPYQQQAVPTQPQFGLGPFQPFNGFNPANNPLVAFGGTTQNPMMTSGQPVQYFRPSEFKFAPYVEPKPPQAPAQSAPGANYGNAYYGAPGNGDGGAGNGGAGNGGYGGGDSANAGGTGIGGGFGDNSGQGGVGGGYGGGQAF